MAAPPQRVDPAKLRLHRAAGEEARRRDRRRVGHAMVPSAPHRNRAAGRRVVCTGSQLMAVGADAVNRPSHGIEQSRPPSGVDTTSTGSAKAGSLIVVPEAAVEVNHLHAQRLPLSAT